MALSIVPLMRILNEYTFSLRHSVILTITFIILPIPCFAVSHDTRQSMSKSFTLLKSPQYILTLLFLPIFVFSSNKLLVIMVPIKTFPLIKTFSKLFNLVKDCAKESYFIKPKPFNIAKLIREIFLAHEPDIILSSCKAYYHFTFTIINFVYFLFKDILSESVNVREASMNKWTLKFKDNNIERRFRSFI